jgi:CheY-like chemotaxis protein
MKEIHVLLVEDNEGDFLLTKESLEKDKLVKKVSVARDGKEAMDFLTSAILISDQMPDIVLLDINLPRKSGHDVLTFIKSSPALKHLPVVMFTSSSSKRDILLAYKNLANCYITKPVDVERFLDVLTKLQQFWITIAQLPKGI